MAASVLGKRTRRTVDAEELALPPPARKRRTCNATPRIHNDEERLSEIQTLRAIPHAIDLNRSLHSHTEASNNPYASKNQTVQNRCKQFSIDKLDLNEESIETATDENAIPFDFDTPTAIRFRDAFLKRTLITPRHRVRLPGTSLTPRSARTGATPPSKSQSIYAVARQLFTQSNTPGRLVGREDERARLTQFIADATKAKSGGCTYISGPPGTGKSALVHEIFEVFQDDAALKATTINCVSVKSSKEVYLKLVQDFCQDVSLGQKSHKDALANLFTAGKKPGSLSHLVVLDELDSLLDGDCDVLYSLFDWALHRTSNLILIGIANALDFTDRFLPRLKARNLKPQLLPFLPYTAKQISEIITERLRSTLPVDSPAAKDFVPFMHPAAIQLSSKKVASQTGDLRKAFNLVRRAIDQVERETSEKNSPSMISSPTKQPLSELSNLARQLPPTPPQSSPLKSSSARTLGQHEGQTFTAETAPRATIAHVARLSSTIFNNGTTSRLTGLNLQQKAVLCSLVANESRRANRDPFKTPSKSTVKIPTVKDLFIKYTQLCRRDEGLLQPLRNGEFRDVVSSLEVLGLAHESTGRASSLLTPTKTPTRAGRNPDDKQIVSAVSQKEMMESLKGPGADLLLRLFDES